MGRTPQQKITLDHLKQRVASWKLGRVFHEWVAAA